MIINYVRNIYIFLNEIDIVNLRELHHVLIGVHLFYMEPPGLELHAIVHRS